MRKVALEMKEQQLLLKHEIPIQVQAECDVSLKVSVNEKEMWTKEYVRDTAHNEIIEFENQYSDAEKNKLTFSFSGEREVEHKHVRILKIIINKQILNLYNAEYFPLLDREWWQGLSNEEKEFQQAKIYGNAGSEFGWYGDINFYFCTGFNYRSRIRYNKNKKDPAQILGEKLNWIYADQNANKMHNRIL